MKFSFHVDCILNTGHIIQFVLYLNMYVSFYANFRFQESASNSTQVQVTNGKDYTFSLCIYIHVSVKIFDFHSTAFSSWQRQLLFYTIDECIIAVMKTLIVSITCLLGEKKNFPFQKSYFKSSDCYWIFDIGEGLECHDCITD